MKKSFPATLWQEDGLVVAQCLEVDVASQGKSEEEALASLTKALNLHFQPPGATVTPQVRTIEVQVSDFDEL